MTLPLKTYYKKPAKKLRNNNTIDIVSGSKEISEAICMAEFIVSD
jgi:hypothetical protein